MKIKDCIRKNPYGYPDKNLCYENEQFKIVIISAESGYSDIYLSIDDGSYKAMIGGMKSASGGKTLYMFEDVNTNVHYELYTEPNVALLKNDDSTFNFYFLKSKDATSEIECEFQDVPQIREPENVLIDDETNDIYVIDNLKYNSTYESYIIHKLSKKDNFKSLKVNQVIRYRDGGTSFYHTVEGVLYMETAFKGKDRKCTFTDNDGKVIDLRLSHETYNYLGKTLCELLGIQWPKN